MSWSDVVGNGDKAEKTPYTKFENGNTLIRILDDEPFSFWSHWLQKQQTSVTCMGRDCPICNIIAQMKANKAEQIYSNSKRHAIRIWNYTTGKMEIMIQGKTFFTDLLTLHKEVGDLKTYDIKVVRKGSGTDTKYTLLPQRESEFEHESDVAEVNMADTFKAPSKEEMLLLIEGKTWAEINGEDEPAA